MDTEAVPSVSNQLPVDIKSKLPLLLHKKISIRRKFKISDQVIGVKISFKDKSSYDKCIVYLKNKNVEFFSHRLKSNIFKVISKGLP